MISEGDIYDVEVKDLGYGAKGLARISSFVVWMNGALPGDIVRIRILKRKPQYAIAEVLEYLEYSNLRVKLRSPHCSSCGCCQLIEMKYDYQLDYKAKQLNEILIRIGKLKDFDQKEMIPSPKIFRYRNKMEFSFSRDENQRIVLGLHYQGSNEKVVEIENCHLQSATANKIFRMAKNYFLSLSEDYLNEQSLPFHHMLIREGKNSGEYLIVLEVNSEVENVIIDLFERMRKAFPEVKSFVIKSMDNHIRLKRQPQQKIIYGSGSIEERIDSLRFNISSDSFFQINTEQTSNMLSIIRNLASMHHVESLLDLYCGSGAISLFLADGVKETLGIDISQDSIQSSIKNADINGIETCHFLCMNAMEATRKFLQLNNRYDLIITNPPRSGMASKVILNMTQLSPRSIIYLSCNPSTLARDCRIFRELGYTLTEIFPIDMFPHTYHIETIAYLRKS